MPICRKTMCGLAACGLLLATSAQAGLEVVFTESAPKDRFTVTNTGDCALNNMNLEVDLSNSAGRLIFDTAKDGAGVEVFQPFEGGKGVELVSGDRVWDGDNRLSLSFKKLEAGARFSFTIDVDDSLPESELGKIRVADSEIQGAVIRLEATRIGKVSAEFGGESRAVIKAPLCS